MNFYSSPRAHVINLYIASKSEFKDDTMRKIVSTPRDHGRERRYERRHGLKGEEERGEKGRRRYECKFNFSFRAKEVDENRERRRRIDG